MKENKTKILSECAVLCAISCVLSLFPKFKFLAHGGSITFCSMLPIVLASYRRGLKWGLLTGLCFALFQFITGFSSAGLTLGAVALSALLDYLVAFTVLGLGGMWRGRFKSVRAELCLGSASVILFRFVASFASGAIVFGEYAEWFFEKMGGFGQSVLSSMHGAPLAMFYSLVYNASYLLPELIITVVVSALISKFALFGLDSPKAA